MKLLSRPALISSIKIILSAFLVWFLTHTSQLKFELLKNLFHDPVLLLYTAGIFLLMVIVNAWRWYRLNVAQGIAFSFSKTIIPTYMGTAFNNILPGSVGGDFIRLYYLYKNAPYNKSRILLSILFDRITGLMGIFITICLVGAMQYNIFHYKHDLFWLLLTGILFCGGGSLIFILSLILPQKIGMSAWLEKYFSHKFWTKSMLSLFEALRIYRNKKLVIIECLLLSVLIQILMVITVNLIAKMMNFPLFSFPSYALAIAATQIVNLVPAAPGGFGVGEIAFSKVLILMNPTVTVATATIFLAYRLIGFMIYTPGALFYLSKFDMFRRTREEKSAAILGPVVNYCSRLQNE